MCEQSSRPPPGGGCLLWLRLRHAAASKTFIRAILVTSFLITGCSTTNRDWNQWRGPLRNGVVTDSPELADTWPESGPDKIWESEPISSKRHGFGSVVVAGKKVYLFVSWRYQDPISLTADLLRANAATVPSNVVTKLEEIADVEFISADHIDDWIDLAGISRSNKTEILSWIPEREFTVTDGVLCLDARTGETIWRFEEPSLPTSFGTSSTPCVVDGRVYVLGSDADLYCLDADTGNKLWQKKLGSGETQTSVAVTDGIVIAAVGPLTALNASTGETLWIQENVPGTYSSPSIWRSEGNTYLLCNSKERLSCVHLADGVIAWTVPGGNHSSTAVSGDHMAVFTGPGGLGLALYRLSPHAAELLWTVELPNKESSPLIYDGHVYAIGGGEANCVDLATGEIRWQFETETDMTSPVVAGGKIYSAAIGTLTMIAPSPEKYTVMSRANLPIGRCVSPAISDGKLYMRMQTGVICYDLTAR